MQLTILLIVSCVLHTASLLTLPGQLSLQLDRLVTSELIKQVNGTTNQFYLLKKADGDKTRYSSSSDAKKSESNQTNPDEHVPRLKLICEGPVITKWRFTGNNNFKVHYI